MNNSRLKHAAAASLLLCGMSFTATGCLGCAPRGLPAGVVKDHRSKASRIPLPNGLKVLLFPDASKPTVTVNVTYLVGSRHENYGETGMAHLLEHMVFKGSPKNKAIPKEFAARGMEFNGTTSNDRTNYYEVFQASPDNLKWALEMEADRMVNSFIARKDLDSEMTVVRNEYEAGENNPFGVLLKRMQSIAYDWHPMAVPPSATAATSRTSRSRTCRPSTHLLPAGQRGAAGGRQIRSGADAVVDHQFFRQDPETEARAAAFLDRRADPGW
jgi:zinc protease